MYGMTAKRFDADIYKGRGRLKRADFIVGFLAAVLAWILFFRPVWYLAPLAIFCVSMFGIYLKFRRRYILYGALSLIFFPLALWGGLMIVWAGRNEMNS